MKPCSVTWVFSQSEDSLRLGITLWSCMIERSPDLTLLDSLVLIKGSGPKILILIRLGGSSYEICHWNWYTFSTHSTVQTLLHATRWTQRVLLGVHLLQTFSAFVTFVWNCSLQVSTEKSLKMEITGTGIHAVQSKVLQTTFNSCAKKFHEIGNDIIYAKISCH